VGGLALAAAVSGFIVAGVGPLSLRFFAPHFSDDARTLAGREVLAAIPNEASVQAPDVLLPHLAERQSVHRMVPPERRVDFWVLDVSHRDRYAGQGTLLRTSEEPRVRAFMARDDRGVRLYRPPFVLLERGLNPRAALTAFRDTEAPIDLPVDRLTDCLGITHATRLTDGGVRLHLRAFGPCPTDLALRMGDTARPTRVDLLFGGAASPAHLQAGDRMASDHGAVVPEGVAIRWLHVGALRASGARPNPGDPTSVALSL